MLLAPIGNPEPRGYSPLDTPCFRRLYMYPLARVRRVLLRAWLDLPQSVSPEPEYVRVLAIGRQGRALLRRMKDTCTLPVIRCV